MPGFVSFDLSLACRRRVYPMKKAVSIVVALLASTALEAVSAAAQKGAPSLRFGMNLDEVQALTARMMSEIVKGDVTTREARAIDRAVGRRLKAIEQELRADA